MTECPRHLYLPQARCLLPEGAMVRIQPGHYGASRTCCCLLPPLRRAHSFPCESPHTVIDDSMRSVHGVSTAQVMNNYSGYERLQPKIPLPRGLSSAQAHHRITLRTRYLSTVTVADFTSRLTQVPDLYSESARLSTQGRHHSGRDRRLRGAVFYR